MTSTLKGDWEGLYRRFFRSPNFVCWYNQRHREVSSKLRLLHLESLAEAKIELWMRDKEEVQLVDMVLRIRNKLEEEGGREDIPDVVVDSLESHVDTIVKTLPQDLQVVLNKDKDKRADDNKVSASPDQGSGASKDSLVQAAEEQA